MEKRRKLFELALLMAVSIVLLVAKVNYYIVMAIAIALIAGFELMRRGHLAELGITKRRIWPAIRIQLPFTVAGIIILLAYASLNGYEIRVPNAMYVFYWLASVPMQEFIFRGYSQATLRDLLPSRAMVSVVAIVFAVSIVFGLLHYFADTPHKLVLIMSTFMAGLLWGLAYEKERNLLGPIFSHLVLGTLIFLILPPPVPLIP